MKRQRTLILLLAALFILSLSSCDKKEAKIVGNIPKDKDVSKAFLVSEGTVYITYDGSVYYQDSSGEKQELHDAAEKEDVTFEEYMEKSEAETPYDELLGVGEDEYLSDYITEDGYIVGKISGKSGTPRAAEEDVIRCKAPQGNSFELTSGGPDGFIRDGEIYYLSNSLIRKSRLEPGGVEETVWTDLGTDICAMAEVGEDILCIEEENDMIAAWLLKADGTLLQLTDYIYPNKDRGIDYGAFGRNCDTLLTDGKNFVYYMKYATEVIFGTLPD